MRNMFHVGIPKMRTSRTQWHAVVGLRGRGWERRTNQITLIPIDLLSYLSCLHCPCFRYLVGGVFPSLPRCSCLGRLNQCAPNAANSVRVDASAQGSPQTYSRMLPNIGSTLIWQTWPIVLWRACPLHDRFQKCRFLHVIVFRVFLLLRGARFSRVFVARAPTGMISLRDPRTNHRNFLSLRHAGRVTLRRIPSRQNIFRAKSDMCSRNRNRTDPQS